MAGLFRVRARNLHLLPSFERIGRVNHDRVLRFDALENLDTIAEIAPDGQLFLDEAVIRPNNGDHGAFGPEEQGIYRDGKPMSGQLHVKVHLGIFALKQRA